MTTPLGPYGSNPKPVKGSGWLASKERSAARKAHERREMEAAKKRDMGKCRWPLCPYAAKKMPVDAAHIFQHRGLGGDKGGTRTERKLCAALCRIHHSLLDRGELEIEALTAQMADGPLAFFSRTESGRMEQVASESRVGVSVTREGA